ncbi:MAG: hypothetical protein ABIQ44_13920, partial [Chloroflexia bacterium]
MDNKDTNKGEDQGAAVHPSGGGGASDRGGNLGGGNLGSGEGEGSVGPGSGGGKGTGGAVA